MELERLTNWIYKNKHVLLMLFNTNILKLKLGNKNIWELLRIIITNVKINIMINYFIKSIPINTFVFSSYFLTILFFLTFNILCYHYLQDEEN
jgi:hypothetical protein